MNSEDKKRFEDNFTWFNTFFQDLGQLMEAIATELVNEFGWTTASKLWYYPKSNYQPGIPGYYLTALNGNKIVVQLFAVLDVSLLEPQPAFTEKEPSLVVVVHSHAYKDLWAEDYGLRVISNNQVSQTGQDGKIITGEILAGGGKGAQYAAFQVTFDAFSTGKDIKTTIKSEIVDVLRELPDWTPRKSRQGKPK